MSLVLYALAAVLYLIYKLVTANNDYFEKKGIPYMKPKFLVGSRSDLLLRNKSMPQVIQEWYEAFPHDKYLREVLFEEEIKTVCIPECRDCSNSSRRLISSAIQNFSRSWR